MKKKALIIGVIGIFLLIQPLSAQTWEAAKRLTWNSGPSENPAVATDSNDHIHVVWKDETPGNFDIFHKRSTDGGVNWTTKRLSSNSGASHAPAIAIASTNYVHVVWQDYTPSNYEIYYRRSTNSGVTWGSVKRLTWNSGDSSVPKIVVDSSDRIHLVWYDGTPGNFEIYYKKSTDSGVTWGGVKRLTWNSGRSFSPTIAVNSSNTVHVAWHDETPGNFEIYYKKSTDSGVTWGGVKRLTWNSGLSWTAEIAVDSSNHVHVLWADESPGNNEIYYKKSTNGGANWTTKRLTYNSGDSKSPAIEIDSNNHIHLAWNDFTPGNHEIYHKKSTDSGVTWGGIKRLTWNSGISKLAEMAVDSNNSIYLVWADLTQGFPNWEIYNRKGIQ